MTFSQFQHPLFLHKSISLLILQILSLHVHFLLMLVAVVRNGISQQLLDSLPFNSLQTFLVPRGLTQMLFGDPLTCIESPLGGLYQQLVD